MLRDRLGQLKAAQAYTTDASNTAERIWERVPGVLSWLIVLAPIWLTPISPTMGLGLVVAATIYFSIRTSLYGPRALLTRRRMLKSWDESWLAKLEGLNEKENLDWRRCRITLLIRAYRERNANMLRATLESICASDWPNERGLLKNVEVLFATEEDDPYTPPIVDRLAEEFAGRLVVRQIRHPEEPNTLPGPSTAMNYVGRALYREALRDGISPREWIIADFDADTLFHPQYLPCLVYHYVSDRNRDLHAYQPVVLFTIDYWKAPLHSRLSAIGVSVLTLGWIRKPEIAFTGAAASLATIHSVGYWPTNSHSQDSGIELRFRMKYGRKFKVIGLQVPLWVYPVMIMGVQHDWKEKIRAYWRSGVALFRQSARWREGPLDEFVEAVTKGYAWLTFRRFLNGLERDTLTVMPGYGVFVATILADPSQMSIDPGFLRLLVGVALSIVSALGLVVFWVMLGTEQFVLGKREPGQRAKELLLFWLVFSVYIPIFTTLAGLKTSTSYSIGKRPRGHFLPTPK
ncbi:MAG: glycosyltransferase [Chloroflexota bacterium]|jgi:hypothetical protein